MTARLAPGSVVRLNDRCPWPERRGLIAVVADPTGAGHVYPVAGLGATEVIVFVNADPLQRGEPHELVNGEPWSCVVHVGGYDVISEAVTP